MTSKHSRIVAHLDDGTSLNLSTEQGANDFLRGMSVGNPEFFSKNIHTIQTIQRKQRLNANDKHKITTMYIFFEKVAGNADLVLFQEKIPESEIKCWLEFTISEIKRFTAMPKWISTGHLEKHDSYVITNCIPFMNHVTVVHMMFEGEFFQALGDLVKARRGTGRLLPCEETCEWIALIVSKGYGYTQNKQWPSGRGFRKLDDSGVLEEFFRCVTVPSSVEGNQGSEMLTYMFNELQGCPATLKHRLKKDDVCGKVARAILEGKDGSKTPRPEAIRRLQEIVTFVDSAYGTGNGSQMGTRICRKCKKYESSEAFQKSLMKCARCHCVYYCSKACQKADWKDHKSNCAPTTKSYPKQQNATREALKKFAYDQYVAIMIKMVSECEKWKTAKRDMIVHLDFRSNEDGIVPAMQDPPMFDVAPTARFLDEKMELENDDSRIRTIQAKYSEMTSNHTLFYVSHNDGCFCLQRNQRFSVFVCFLPRLCRGKLYSDEAFEAFRSGIIDHDYDLIFRTFSLDVVLAADICTTVAMSSSAP